MGPGGAAADAGHHLGPRRAGDGHRRRRVHRVEHRRRPPRERRHGLCARRPDHRLRRREPAAELIVGSASDLDAVTMPLPGAEPVIQAAHRAVLRSVEHPLESDTANTHGTLTILKAAQDAHVRRVVYSSSSSVYGGAEQLPTPESAPPSATSATFRS
ncbi:MAG: NAD-dependent epimerase/dehydratase family protein [Acidimicrobiia bacterium]|nr:NAD-dependent epimerase/dehydratase family protein [Acidimicrobiia bacterium]